MASRTPPSDALAAWLAAQRWFAAKTRRIVALAVEDVIALGPGLLAVARVALDDGATDRYALTLRPGAEPAEALDEPEVARRLLALMAAGGSLRGARGALVGARTTAFPAELPPGLDVRRLGGEQSNTSVVFGQALILKLFRRLAPGVNPEAELTRFLTERARFPHAPRLAGVLDYRPDVGATATLAVLQELVPDGQDGWAWVLERLARLCATAPAAPPSAPALQAAAADTLGALRRLGEVTAALHRALAVDGTDPAFAPEPITAEDLAAWTAEVARGVAAARAVLGATEVDVDPSHLAAGLAVLRGRRKLRIHGDLHLGQTLRCAPPADWVLLDFEGEPLRPLAERRRKHAALRDLAGLLRSVDYAAAAALRHGPAGPGAEAWAAAWREAAAAALVEGYLALARGTPFVPLTSSGVGRALAVFELEKAAYEVVYEANHRPDWLAIPRAGLLRACAALTRAVRAGAP